MLMTIREALAIQVRQIEHYKLTRALSYLLVLIDLLLTRLAWANIQRRK